MKEVQFDRAEVVNPEEVFEGIRSAVNATDPDQRTPEQAFVLRFAETLVRDERLRAQVLKHVDQDVRIAPTIGPAPKKCPTCGRGF